MKTNAAIVGVPSVMVRPRTFMPITRLFPMLSLCLLLLSATVSAQQTCDKPTFNEVHLIQGSCDTGRALADGGVYISNVSRADKAGISLGTNYQGPGFKESNALQSIVFDYVYFEGLSPSTTYTVRIWNNSPSCFVDITFTSSEMNCAQWGGIEGFVDKSHVQLQPVLGSMRDGNPCGPGIVTTTSCEGTSMTINRSNLNTERYIALHGVCGPGNATLPACISYVTDQCTVIEPEYVYCFDYNKASGLGAGFAPGTVQFISQVGIDGISTMNELKAARISYVFENLDNFGFDINNSTHRRALQLISWKIINPEEPGVQDFNCDNAGLPRVCTGAANFANWCEIFNAALTAVPDDATIPNLSMTPASSSALISEQINITLTTNENEIELMVSDGGAMPQLCGASVGQGHQIIDNNDGTGLLILAGSGSQSVELCFSRPVSADFTFQAEIVTNISDGSSFIFYMPQPPYAETVQPFFSYRESVLRPRATVQLQFLGDLTINCPDGLELPCLGLSTVEIDNWLNSVTAEADCGVASITNNYNPNGFAGGACPQTGTQIVTFTVTDNCGQTETCTAVITITNETGITWDFLPGDITISCDVELPMPNATAFDNCGAVTVSSEDIITEQGCPQNIIVQRTYMASDACGNTAIHIQTITVVDNIPPSFGDGADCWPSGLAATSFGSQQEAADQFEELLFSAIGRIGNNAQGGTHELALQNTTPVNVLSAADLQWPQGQTVSFEVNYNPNASGNQRLIYTVTSGMTQRVMQIDPSNFYDFPLDIDGIILQTSTVANGTVQVSNITLNSQSINGTFGHSSPASAQNSQTVITGANLVDGFNLNGTVVLDWQGSIPSNDELFFGFSFGKLECSPGASCPEDLTVDCSDPNFMSTINAWLGAVTATDNCGNATVEHNFGGDFSCGVYTVTWVASDDCGNTSTCSAELTIEGSQSMGLTIPTLDPLLCGAEGNLGIVQSWLNTITASGPCGAITPEISLTAEQIISALSNATYTVGAECTASVEVLVTASDDCGTSLSQSVQIISIDNINPTIECPSSLNLECGDLANEGLIESWLNSASGSDNCSEVLLSNNFSMAGFTTDCGLSGIQQVTFTATDACGNTAVCQSTVFIADNTPPVFVNPPANLTLSCDDTVPSPEVNAVDNCGAAVVTMVETVTTGTCPTIQTIQRVYSATDDCGNITTHTQNIVIQDTQVPTFTFIPSNVTISCAETPVLENATAVDNCSDVTIEVSTTESAGSCPSNFTITRVFTATDICGNSAQATQVITVVDNESPNFTFVPSDITASCDQELILGNATATDNCTIDVNISVSTQEISGICASNFQLIRTFTATDACGNQQTAVQSILVNDTEAPIFTNVPSDLTLDCADPNLSSNIQNWLNSASATDNCGTVTITNNFGDADACDFVTVTFVATDECGNANTAIANLTIQGSVEPGISVAAAPVLFCGASNNLQLINNWLNTAQANGSCGAVDVSISHTAQQILSALEGGDFEGSCIESFTVTFTAQDPCGSELTISRVVTLEDNTDPIISCPSDLVLVCGASGNEQLINNWLQSVTASDECTDVAITNNYNADGFNLVCGLSGSQIVVFTATDACGNQSTCTATIILTDTQAPTFTIVPNDLTISCEDPIPSSDVVATDDCGDVSITMTESQENGACDASFTIRRTFIATDDCGNTASFTHTIVVQDQTAPEFTFVPGDLTLACGDIPVLEDAVASDNCGDVTITVSTSEQEGVCPANVVITRVFTATDECGNAAQATQTITLIDDEAPDFVFIPADLTLDCSESIPMELATAIDNCSSVDIQVNDQEIAGICDAAYTINRIFTATDACGNQAQVTQTISVVDNTAPVFNFLPEPLEIECNDDNIEATIASWLNSVQASDNCSSVTIISDYNGAFSCGVYNINVTAFDDCGNENTEVIVLTITGSGDLTVNIPTAPEVLCGNEDNVLIVQDWLNSVTVTGACGNVQLTSNLTAEEIVALLEGSLIDAKGECQLIIDVIFTTSDACGEPLEFEAEISIVDSDPPVLECPEPLVVECGDPALEVIIQSWLDSATAIDNCTEPEVINSYDISAFIPGCGNTATQFVFFEAIDECGNRSNCLQTIEIVDTTPPAFDNIPEDLTLSCEETIPASTIDAFDNCGTVEVVMSEFTQNGSCPSAFVITRTFTATDECGNVSTHTQTITVEDHTAPEFTFVPGDYTISCEQDIIRENATATDNCGTVNIVTTENLIEGDCDFSFTIVRTFTATDECGNQSISTQTITVVDETAPEFTFVPEMFTIECDDQNLTTVIVNWLGTIQATDNCALESVVNNYNGSTDCGEYIITFTATDECGNTTTTTSSFSISGAGELDLIVPSAPQLECGVSNNENIVSNWLSSVTAIGGCGSVQVVSNKTASEIVMELNVAVQASGVCAVNTTVTFTTSDLCGTAVSSVVSIQLIDSNPPVIDCPNDLTIECGDENFDILIQNWLNSVSATDNCTDVTVSNTYQANGFSDLCGATGVQVVTFTAMDNCGNATTCSASIIIQDTNAPEFTLVPEDLTLSCDATLPSSMAEASDLCGMVDVIQSETTVSGDCPSSFVLLRTFVATDECGNQSTYTQTITVIDDQAPVFTVTPSDVTIDCTAPIPTTSAEAIDNCGDVVINVVDVTQQGTCPSSFTIVRTFTATDLCGNQAFHTQQITVIDTEGPEFTFVPDHITVSCELDIVLENATATDNCSDFEINVSSETVEGDCPNRFVIVRTFIATDVCGNQSEATQTITVTDDVPPSFISIPADYTLSCEEDVIREDAIATDNCSIPSVTVSETLEVGDCAGSGTITRVFTATDDCGNVSTAVQVISIINDSDPSFTFVPEDVTLSCEETIEFIDATANDLCGSVVVTEDRQTNEGDCPNRFEIVRTFTATDDCGNTAVATQTITVTDDVAPVFTFVPSSFTALCIEDVEFENAVAIDNCGPVTITVEVDSIPSGCPRVYTLIRTFTAVDACGNESIETQTIDVDFDAPVFTFVPADYTASCEDELVFDLPEIVFACDGIDFKEDRDTIPGDCPQNFTIVRTFTATKSCLTEIVASQTITVVDTTAPVFVFVPDDLTLSCTDEIIEEDAVATDNCSQVFLSANSNIVPSDCPETYTIVRTFTATDLCGNFTTASQSIFIIDSIAPVFTFVPADYAISCELAIERADAEATDDCSLFDISVSESIIEGECPNNFTILRTFTATDACGNASSATQQITVFDNTPPTVLNPPVDVTLNCGDIIPTYTPQFVDNCDGPISVVAELPTIEPGCNRVFEEIYTGTDACGNSTSVTRRITYVDNIAPVFTFVPPGFSVSCEQDIVLLNAVAQDNCDGLITPQVTQLNIQGPCIGGRKGSY